LAPISPGRIIGPLKIKAVSGASHPVSRANPNTAQRKSPGRITGPHHRAACAAPLNLKAEWREPSGVWSTQLNTMRTALTSLGRYFIGSVFINAYLGFQRTNAISWVIRCKEI
jgi:hypothetical protein